MRFRVASNGGRRHGGDGATLRERTARGRSRGRRAVAAALAALAIGGAVAVAPPPAAATTSPLYSLSLSLSAPADNADVQADSVKVTGTVHLNRHAAPTSRIVLLDLSADPKGFACDSPGTTVCSLEALRRLLLPLVDQGNVSVAVIPFDELSPSIFDLDPEPGIQVFVPAEHVLQLVENRMLLTQTRSPLARAPFLEAADIAAGLGPARGTRALVVTPAHSTFGYAARDAIAAFQKAGLPGDVFPTGYEFDNPCLDASTMAARFAAETGGMCTRADDLPANPPDQSIVVKAWAERHWSRSVTLPQSGAFQLTVPLPTGNLSETTLTVQASGPHGTIATTTRTVGLGTPQVSAGPAVEVGEGSTITLAGATATDPSGGLSTRWAPTGSFVDNKVLHAVFADTADDADTAVTLTAVDRYGRQSSSSTSVSVLNVAPTVSVRHDGDVLGVGDATTIEATVLDPGVRDTHRLRIDWGDGTIDDIAVVTDGVTTSPRHAYDRTGVHEAIVTAYDDDGGVSEPRRLEITVQDIEAPRFPVQPVDIEAEATGPDGAVLEFVVPDSEDDVDAAPEVTCDPAPGDTAPLGPSQVTCTAVDDAGNETHTTFTVTVVDTTAPHLTGMPGDVRLRTGPGDVAVADYQAPTAADLVDQDPVVECTPAPGTELPVGHHVVTCTAHDDAGNRTTASFTIEVVPGYTFVGFDRPVDAGRPNDVRRGSTVPLKWQVLDANGNPVSDLAVVERVLSFDIACPGGGAIGPEVAAASTTGLFFDETDRRYHFNWTVPGTEGCRRVVVRLVDGSVGSADFRIR